MNTFNIVFGQLLHFFLLLMVGMLLAKLKIVTVLASGGNDHSESGEINQFQSH